VIQTDQGAARRERQRLAMRRWRSKPANRKKAAAYQEAYRKSHLKEARERWYRWRAKNPEKAKALDKRAYEKGKKIPRVRKQRLLNSRKHYQKNKIRWRAYEHVRRLREHKDCADLVYTAKEWNAAVDARFKLFGNRCAKCGSKKLLEVDHVVPLARGGSHLPENIQPLCRRCNRSKGARSEG
jgi:5-methylcytosine-specific restriction endonuclease McrA